MRREAILSKLADHKNWSALGAFFLVMAIVVAISCVVFSRGFHYTAILLPYGGGILAIEAFGRTLLWATDHRWRRIKEEMAREIARMEIKIAVHEATAMTRKSMH